MAFYVEKLILCEGADVSGVLRSDLSKSSCPACTKAHAPWLEPGNEVDDPATAMVLIDSQGRWWHPSCAGVLLGEKNNMPTERMEPFTQIGAVCSVHRIKANRHCPNCRVLAKKKARRELILDKLFSGK